MGLSALERPAGAPTQVTTRDRVIIGGRRLEDLFADVMTGGLTYESNLLRILCGRTLDADLVDLAAPMLIGLATGQADGRDLACVRLSASTHAPFEQAIAPAALRLLKLSLVVVVSSEALVALKDHCDSSNEEVIEVVTWMARTIVNAATDPAYRPTAGKAIGA